MISFDATKHLKELSGLIYINCLVFASFRNFLLEAGVKRFKIASLELGTEVIIHVGEEIGVSIFIGSLVLP